MNIIAHIITWLNGWMNALSVALRGPMSAMPPWLSLTIISSVLGVVMLIPVKYISPQTAISRARDRIKARLLAMKLFKDNIPVVLKSQMQVILAALMLPVYMLPPVLVMLLPFSLVLGQMGVWYQARALDVNEQAVIVMQLSESENSLLPPVVWLSTDAVEVVAGPVRVPSKQQVYWKIKAIQPGVHQLQFDVGNFRVSKELSIGSGFMPVSMKRPSMHIGDLILYPAEKPFGKDSLVQSIEIGYPDRVAPVTGSGNWVISLFVISMIAALAVKPIVGVKL